MRRSALGFFCFLSFTGLLAVPQIANAALSITNPANLGTYTTGTVQIPLQATGGTGALTWTVSSGTLPAGLAIRTDVPSFLRQPVRGFSVSQQRPMAARRRRSRSR